ncbi:MAG: patatin-like phospholipase family protein [Anaerolineales bacterium]|jgi:NTE family protein
MIAFVLSGGGSRGALQVGALQVLIEAGIKPEMVVGSSVGAINGAAIAVSPDAAGVKQLERFWLGAESTRIYSPNLIKMALRVLLKRNSLVSSDEFHRFVRRHVLPQAETFADLEQVQLYIAAVELVSGQLHIFGDDPLDSIVDAIMASTSIQPFFPPWAIAERRFIDGGYLSNLPLLTAIERGADEIYALDLTALRNEDECTQGLIPILLHEADIVLYHLAQFEIEQGRRVLGRRLHHIQMTDYDGHSLFDFSRTREMIGRGRRIMYEYLERQPASGAGRASSGKDLRSKPLHHEPAEMISSAGVSLEGSES